MPGKESARSFVGELGRCFVAAFAELGREAVVDTGIGLDFNMPVVLERLARLRDRRGGDEVVVLSEMEQKRHRDGVRFVEEAVDSARIITDAGIK